MEQTAIFAGGCFWCMVEPFEQRPGIIQVRSGYTGGELENPSYAQVCTNTTGHVEAVQVTFDDTQVSYRELVDLYWQTFDPTDVGGQFFDRGSSYAPVIFYADEAQREVAEQSKADLAASGRFSKPIAVPIQPAKPFYEAEDYHQGYYKKNAAHYTSYATGSGRKAFITKHWGDNT